MPYFKNISKCFCIIKKYLLSLIFTVLVYTSHQSFGAAWLQNNHEGLLIVTAQPYISCKYWDKTNHLLRGPCFNQFTLNPYFEYGLFEWFTLVLSPAFNAYSQSGQTSTFNAGYMMTAGRVPLWRKDWATLSAQVGYNQKFKSSNFGQDTPSAQSTLANEQNYIDIRVMYGIGGWVDDNTDFSNRDTWYVNLEGAFQPYFTGAANQFHIDTKFGWKTLKDRKLIFEVNEINTISVGKPRRPQDPDYDLFTIIPSIMYRFIPELILQVGVSQDFYGRNIGMGTSPFGAVWWLF